MNDASKILTLVLACWAWPAGAAGSLATLTDYVLYGIEQRGGRLIRYSLADAATTVVGPIVDSDSGTVLRGIEAAAHLPGHPGIIGFWTDPGDRLVKQVHISLNDASASPATVASLRHFGNGRFGGAVAAERPGGERYPKVYAVQAAGLNRFGRFAAVGLSDITVALDDGARVDGDLAIGPNGIQALNGGSGSGSLVIDPTADDANPIGAEFQRWGNQDLRPVKAYLLELSRAAAELASTQTFGAIAAATAVVGNGGLNVIAAGRIRH